VRIYPHTIVYGFSAGRFGTCPYRCDKIIHHVGAGSKPAIVLNPPYKFDNDFILRTGENNMAWLEVVTVRTAGETEFLKALEFCCQMNQSLKAENSMIIKAFRNTSYEMDLSIHIYREPGPAMPAKTPCGIRLSKLLSRFGIVDHTVWRPVRLDEASEAVSGKARQNCPP
jgi:hypothetical protein